MGFLDIIIMSALVAGSLYVLYRHFSPSGKSGCAGCGFNDGSCDKQYNKSPSPWEGKE